jgi:ABC-2 type transport system permease protein
MPPALLILAKDLRLRARDRSAFVMAVVAPLSLAFILNSVIDLSEEVEVDYGIVDHDGGELAAGFQEGLETIDVLDLELRVDLTEAEARELIEQDELDAAFVLPEGFSDAAMSGAGDEADLALTVVGNRDSTIGTQIASSIAGEFGNRLDAARLSVATVVADGRTDTDVNELVEEAAGQPPPVQVAVLEADDRQLDSTTYLIAGMAVLFLFFTVTFGVMGIFEERDQGTLPRLRAAPIGRWSMLAAKLLGSVVMGVLAMTTLVVASTVLMGADWGDPLVVFALSIAAVLAAVSIIGVVVAFTRKAEQASAAQSIIAMALAVIGGSFFPVAQGEGWLARLSTLTPHYWFLRGLGDGLAGGLGDAWPAVAALLAFAGVFGAIGAVALARRGSSDAGGGLAL